MRCFRIYLREKTKLEITTESPVLPWLVRHCGAIWYKLPETADLTKLDDHWRTAIWLGTSDRSDEHIIGLENGAILARSVRRKVEGKRWSERALKMVTGTPWNPRPGEVVARREYITRALVERYGKSKASDGWSERALKMVTGTPWNPRPGEVVARREYITRALVERYGQLFELFRSRWLEVRKSDVNGLMR